MYRTTAEQAAHLTHVCLDEQQGSNRVDPSLENTWKDDDARSRRASSFACR